MCELHRPEDVERTPCGISDFIDELVVAGTNARIYYEGHPRVQTSIQELISNLQAQCKEDDQEALIIGTAEGFLFYDERPLMGASLSASKVIEALEALDSGGLHIDRRATELDFLTLLEILAKAGRAHANFTEANRDLNNRGCNWVRFLPPYDGGALGPSASSNLVGALGELGGRGEGEHLDINIPVELYQKTVSLLQDSMVRACHGEDLGLDETRGFVEAILDRLTIDPTSMLNISRYERYDAYTFGHSIRVCLLALNFARTLVDDQKLLMRIGMAALMHDVGKAWVPFEVLYSTTRLSDEERLEMNKHTSYGAQILLEAGDPDPLSVSSAFGHHRTLDGGGYPDTLHSLRQSVCTRIVKICDVYEALTAVRPYKPRMSPIRAYRIMMDMENHFDSRLLRRFVAVNGVFPVGSQVLLTTGEPARVLRQTHDPQRPLIRIDPAAGGDGRQIDLASNPDPSAPRVDSFIEAA